MEMLHGRHCGDGSRAKFASKDASQNPRGRFLAGPAVGRFLHVLEVRVMKSKWQQITPPSVICSTLLTPWTSHHRGSAMATLMTSKPWQGMSPLTSQRLLKKSGGMRGSVAGRTFPLLPQGHEHLSAGRPRLEACASTCRSINHASC